MKFINVEATLERLLNNIIDQIPSVLIGLAIMVIGRYVIGFLLKIIDKRFEKRNFDISIRSFVKSLIKFTLYAFLLLTAATTMGFQTTSFIAALSAFGLAVGMALQGSLSNFAGGVLILIFRPFDVGDYISSANGSSGTVEKIDLLYTTLIDDDGIRVFSPNGTLANSVIKNFTKISARRMQFSFLIAYDTNIKLARETILAVLNEDQRVLQKPKAELFVGDLKESGITITIRAWTNREVYWATKNELAERIKDELDNKAINFPTNAIKILNN
ncbi:mechanosensitive ion channel family protein [Sphingobacterium sp. HJSM2_6]|uniref:mechanosensitive ion channel family protein n=1 Tax=Sphingobacterium sp. HJSM2_6 TaxID=3366264 RepID=UPI003BDD7E29